MFQSVYPPEVDEVNPSPSANGEALSVKLIRQQCTDCSGESARYILWCPCDGRNSTRCHLWPFRFGQRPETIRAKYGDRLVTPEKMPPADVEIERLPGTMAEAATAEISVDGYHQPAVVVKPRPQISESERQRLAQMGAKTRFPTIGSLPQE